MGRETKGRESARQDSQPAGRENGAWGDPERPVLPQFWDPKMGSQNQR